MGRKWPINVRVLIEGEEESGGANIERLVRENPQKFQSDVCLVSDTGFIDQDTPAIEIGLRGIVYFELEIITAKNDLHSGLYGGAAHNPLNILSRILSKLEEKMAGHELRREPVNAEFPSFDVHGISGGFQDEGAKTVIPMSARAKFSIRLVPGQNPNEIEKQVRAELKMNLPRGVKTNLKTLGKGEPFSVRNGNKYLGLACASIREIFDRKPIMTKSGGSIPIVATISSVLGAEVILMGYGLPDDNLHAPNEKFDLHQFYKGIECNMDFLRRLGKDN